MHGKLPLLLLLICATGWFSLYAQAPFTGGSGNGDAAIKLTVSSCQAITANPYSGGKGNDTIYADVINSSCTPGFILPYGGGIADGFGEANEVVSICYPTELLPYSGGVADGYNENTSIVSTCYSVIVTPYSGGIAEGYGENADVVSTCSSIIINPYSGGIADGYSENASVVSLCSPVLLTPFGGGIADGFNEAQLINSFCAPLLVTIFSGGIADGFSDALVYSSLGFNVPSPATTPVCVNSEAYIGLPSNPGASLTYQWQVSTDGGNTFNALSDNSPYTGSGTDTLWINPVTNTYNGYVYRVAVSYPGCASGYSSNSAIAVGQQPVSPTIVKNPNVLQVCPGTDVSATFVAGTGGVGTVTDTFQYSTDAGTTWNPYITNTPVATDALQGINVVQVETWRTTNGQGCVNPEPNLAEWTVAGVGYWVGVTSPDWNTASNWGCGVVPDSTTDVTIPEVEVGNNQPNVFNVPDAYAHDLTIQTNASVTTYFGYNLDLYGDFENDGISSLGIGTVKFNGYNTQNITGRTPSAFSYVDVNNNSAPLTALVLDQDITVSNDFTIVNGMVDLNGSNIGLGNTGTLYGETETSRITGSSGQIQSNINMSASNTAYNNIHGIGVDLTTGETAPGLTQVNRGHHIYDVPNPAIQRYFEIIPTVNGGLNATMKMHFFDAELAAGNQSEADLYPYNSEDMGQTWAVQYFPELITRDMNVHWVQQTNIDSFSFWTLDDFGDPLPVELLDFTAWPDGSIVRLKWETTIEINNHYFTVERSQDAINFQDILTVPGAGNSSVERTYNAIDYNPLPGVSYYRLRQTDFNGVEALSQIVSVSFNPSGSLMFNAFVGASQNFYVLYQSTDEEQLSIAVYDITGRIVIAKSIASTRGDNNILLENPGLASGIYTLELIAGEDEFRGVKKLFVTTK